MTSPQTLELPVELIPPEALIDASDVNAYLRNITGQPFTAKDFRTWMGTVLALQALSAAPTSKTKREVSRQITEAVTLVASRLGNTATISRKCYIHPDIIGAYTDGRLPLPLATGKRLRGLSVDEMALLRLLIGGVVTTTRRKRSKAPAEVQPLQQS